MADERTVEDLFGAKVFDAHGTELGDIKEIFLDAKSGDPTFVSLGNGIFNRGSLVVPLRGAELRENGLHLGFLKSEIEKAPHLDVDNGITDAQRARIYEHYGLSVAETRAIYDDIAVDDEHLD